MLRLVTLGTLFYLAVTHQIPAIPTLPDPTPLVAVLIALLLLPTLKQHLD